MNITLQQTEKLFSKEDLTFKAIGFSMFITNLKKFHTSFPKLYPLEDCNAEINRFLDKCKSTMIEDYEVISKL